MAVLAISMMAMLAMSGLVVDGARSWVTLREVQTAADAAALAGMKAMLGPGLTTTDARRAAAVSAAQAMATLNGATVGTVSCPGGTPVQGVVVNNPPASGPNSNSVDHVEVLVTSAMPTTFSVALGQPCWLVSARAVARVVSNSIVAPASAYPAILATLGPSPCSSGAYSNSGAFTIAGGDVISNSGIHDSSVITAPGRVTYMANPPNTCGTDETGTATWTGIPVTTVTAYPITYTFNTSTRTITNNNTGATASCTYWWTGSTTLGNGAWWVNGASSSRQLNPGVYCATGDIGLATGSTVGNVTFVAGGKITISAGGVNLSAHWNNLLAFSTATGATTVNINFSGSNGRWAGLLFAPSSKVQVSGGGNYTYNAALWGKTVHTSGTDWALNSTSLLLPAAATVITYLPGTLVE